MEKVQMSEFFPRYFALWKWLLKGITILKACCFKTNTWETPKHPDKYTLIKIPGYPAHHPTTDGSNKSLGRPPWHRVVCRASARQNQSVNGRLY